LKARQIQVRLDQQRSLDARDRALRQTELGVLNRAQIHGPCVVRLSLQHFFEICHARVMVAHRAGVQGQMKVFLGVEHGGVSRFEQSRESAAGREQHADHSRHEQCAHDPRQCADRVDHSGPFDRLHSCCINRKWLAVYAISAANAYDGRRQSQSARQTRHAPR